MQGNNRVQIQDKEKQVTLDIYDKPHRRYNPLTGEWLLLSPHRTKRPWQGKNETPLQNGSNQYDTSCYLCPGNTRSGGIKNPEYTGTFVFDNDFSALMPDSVLLRHDESELFQAKSAGGTCRVICFSERHDLTLAEMDEKGIEVVISTWMHQNEDLGKTYTWVQIFENKGEIMGCSNPHPHGQIWASDFLPEEPAKEDENQKSYFKKNGRALLLDYLKEELTLNERIVVENDTWAALVPYWAIWPFEIMLIPRKHTKRISDLDSGQKEGIACIMKKVLVKYDNIFKTSFPYSMGWHGAPFFTEDTDHWQLHAHYYPPLLRSASVKKFMVGFEMLGCAQRDITPETASQIIREQSDVHYKNRKVE